MCALLKVPRTNNHIGGYDLKLPVAHSDIYKVISVFQEEQTIAFISYYKAINGDSTQSQKKTWVGKRWNINNLETSLDTYVKKLVILLYISIDKPKSTGSDSEAVTYFVNFRFLLFSTKVPIGEKKSLIPKKSL